MKSKSKKAMIELIVTGILLFVLVLIVVFVVIPALLPKGVKIKHLAKTTLPNKPAMVFSASSLRKTYVIQKEIPLKEAENDPFKPGTFVKVIEDDSYIKHFKVTGISILGDTRFAIINDSVSKIGDEILDARVIAINTDTVVVQKGDKEYILNIQGD